MVVIKMAVFIPKEALGKNKVSLKRWKPECSAGVYQYSIEVELNNQSTFQINDLPDEVR